MASLQHDFGKDVHLKGAAYPGLRIELSKSSGLSDPLIVVEGNITHSDGAPISGHTYSVLLKGKRGDLTIRENNQGDQYQAYTRINRDAFIVVQFDDLNESGDRSNTWTIRLALKPNYSLAVDTDGNKKPAVGKRGRDPMFFERLADLTMLWRHRALIPEIRFVKITIPAYKSVAHGTAFNADITRKIMNQELLTSSSVVPAKFASLQIRAFQGEDQIIKQLQEKLVRNNVTIRFNQLSGYLNTWYCEMHQHPSSPQWLLKGQERIILAYPGENPPGLFSQVPTQTPGQRSPDLWRATVFFRHGQPCAAINNVLRPNLINVINSMREIRGVRLYLEDEEDPVTNRALNAVKELQQIMERAVDPTYEVTSPVRLNWHIPPTGIFLSDRRGMMKLDVPNTSINGNPMTLIQNPAYQLGQATHVQAFKNAFTSGSGISLIQGPPATGKTELVSKLIGFTIRHANLPPNETVVLAAHTNVAVAVACERFLKHCDTMFKLDKNIACLIWTSNKTEYGRLVSQNLPPQLAAISLDAHCDRVANAEPERFHHYIQGRNRIRQQGRIENMSELGKYLRDQKTILAILKRKIKVWFCTLATFHHDSPVFGREKGWTGVDCSLLIIDEASQAHSVAAWLPWHVLNPRRIVLAGDHLQLAPHLVSTEAEWAWKQSLFEQLREDRRANISHVMLDLQFRTVKNIYAGTNVFYENRVQTNPTTVGRPLAAQLLKAVERIHFVDAKKVKHQLSMNTHWFDIKNGQHIVKGDTSSSTNQLEMNFLQNLFAALQTCGIPGRVCMLLTGYQAFYDDLMEAEKMLPSAGTIIKKVDSAQGDEGDIVGLALVRTGASLGFMAQKRRQNVMTSRAREGLYGVGQRAAIQTAQKQGAGAWADWFENMIRSNGPGWAIQFEGPVKFFVDGNAVTLRSRGVQEVSEPPASTFSGFEAAVMQDPEPSSPRSGSQPRTPVRPSTPVQPGTPTRPNTPHGQSPQSGSPKGVQLPVRPTTPQGQPGTPSRSPQGSSPSVGQRSPSVSLHQSPSTTLRRRTSHGGSGGQGGSQPRRPSLLNPEHGRSASGQSVAQYARPTGLWTTEAVTNVVNLMDTRDGNELMTRIPNNIRNMHRDHNNVWTEFKAYVDQLTAAQTANDVARFNNIIDEIRNRGYDRTFGEHAAIMAHSFSRLWALKSVIIPWRQGETE